MQKKELMKICLIVFGILQVISIAVNLFVIYLCVTFFRTAELFNVVLIPIVGILVFLTGIVNNFISLYAIGKVLEDE